MKKYQEVKKIMLVAFFVLISTFTYANNSLSGITLKDINNRRYSFGQTGRPVFLKIWASWCPVCLNTLAETDEFSKKTKDFDVVTVVFPGIMGEKNSRDFINWYKSLGYKNIRVLLDDSGALLRKISVNAVPTSVFLTKNGEIIRAIPGALPEQVVEQFMGTLKVEDKIK